MCIDVVMRVSSALLTPLIAIVATYIAWQQWKTNQRKLIMDRYDRRLRIYEEVRKILSIITRDNNLSSEDLLQLQTSVSEADFLFGPEVIAYVNELYIHGVALRRWNQECRDHTQEKPQGYNHAKVVAERDKELTWLIGQFKPAKQKFMKYLDISN